MLLCTNTELIFTYILGIQSAICWIKGKIYSEVAHNPKTSNLKYKVKDLKPGHLHPNSKPSKRNRPNPINHKIKGKKLRLQLFNKNTNQIDTTNITSNFMVVNVKPINPSENISINNEDEIHSNLPETVFTFNSEANAKRLETPRFGISINENEVKKNNTDKITIHNDPKDLNSINLLKNSNEKAPKLTYISNDIQNPKLTFVQPQLNFLKLNNNKSTNSNYINISFKDNSAKNELSTNLTQKLSSTKNEYPKFEVLNKELNNQETKINKEELSPITGIVKKITLLIHEYNRKKRFTKEITNFSNNDRIMQNELNKRSELIEEEKSDSYHKNNPSFVIENNKIENLNLPLNNDQIRTSDAIHSNTFTSKTNFELNQIERKNQDLEIKGINRKNEEQSDINIPNNLGNNFTMNDNLLTSNKFQ